MKPYCSKCGQQFDKVEREYHVCETESLRAYLTWNWQANGHSIRLVVTPDERKCFFEFDVPNLPPVAIEPDWDFEKVKSHVFKTYQPSGPINLLLVCARQLLMDYINGNPLPTFETGIERYFREQANQEIIEARKCHWPRSPSESNPDKIKECEACGKTTVGRFCPQCERDDRERNLPVFHWPRI